MIKILVPNERGKIEFTPKQLEFFIQEVTYEVYKEIYFSSEVRENKESNSPREIAETSLNKKNYTLSVKKDHLEKLHQELANL